MCRYLPCTLRRCLQNILEWRPDAVITCSESYKHAELIPRSVPGRAHILCEKPLAPYLAHAKDGITVKAPAKVISLTAIAVRSSAVYQELRAFVRAGLLGQVLSIVGITNGWLPSDRAWLTDPVLVGGA
ncbi:Gfo/Idh/MocA family oxidoreductase [Arthrobacter antibioticus]